MCPLLSIYFSSLTICCLFCLVREHTALEHLALYHRQMNIQVYGVGKKMVWRVSNQETHTYTLSQITGTLGCATVGFLLLG